MEIRDDIQMQLLDEIRALRKLIESLQAEPPHSGASQSTYERIVGTYQANKYIDADKERVRRLADAAKRRPH